MEGLRDGLETDERGDKENIIAHTLQAYTSTQADASSTSSALLANNCTACSLAALFSFLSTDPHTSAIALCISGRHFGSVDLIAFHVDSSNSGWIDGTRRKRKRVLNVSSKTVRESGDIERGRSFRSRLMMSSYTGAIVVRKS